MKPIKYRCSFKSTTWEGTIKNFTEYHDIIQCTFEGRGSSIVAFINKDSCCRWILMPYLDIGTTLSALNDYYWNNEKLSNVLDNCIDSITIASGLVELSKII